MTQVTSHERIHLWFNKAPPSIITHATLASNVEGFSVEVKKKEMGSKGFSVQVVEVVVDVVDLFSG